MQRLLEIACFNAESAVIAQQAGADRIELCDNYKNGGVTPQKGTLVAVCSRLHIPVHVIIRPRGGNFVYSPQEVEAMKEAITFCRTQPVKGLVLGALTTDDQVDAALCKELITLANPLPVSFHRAIDHCKDHDAAMKQLIGLGVQRVLTSGFSEIAVQGLSDLKYLQATYGQQIIIMPGGGIRSSNIQSLMQSGCTEYHSAAITGASETADASEIKKLKQEMQLQQAL